MAKKLKTNPDDLRGRFASENMTRAENEKPSVSREASLTTTEKKRNPSWLGFAFGDLSLPFMDFSHFSGVNGASN